MNTRIILAILAAAALPVAAQTGTPRVDERQAKVQAVEDKPKSDGQVTKKERAKLAKAQDKQSRKIHKQKHDKQKQAPAT